MSGFPLSRLSQQQCCFSSVFFQPNLDARNMKGKIDSTRSALFGLCHHHRLPTTETPRSKVLKSMVAYEQRSHKNDLLLMSCILLLKSFSALDCVKQGLLVYYCFLFPLNHRHVHNPWRSWCAQKKTNQKSGEESLAEPVLIVIGRSDFWG